MMHMDPFESFLLNLADAERKLLEELARMHRNDVSLFEKYLIWRKKKRFLKVLRWLKRQNDERKQRISKDEAQKTVDSGHKRADF